MMFYRFDGREPKGSWVWKFAGLEVRWSQDRDAIQMLAVLAIGTLLATVFFWWKP